MTPNQEPGAPGCVWTDDEHPESESQHQIPPPQQHGAHVGYQRKRPSPRLPRVIFTSKASEKPIRQPKATSVTYPRSPQRVSISPGPSLGGSQFDPFDAFCVTNLSGLSQTMFQFATIDLWPSFAMSSEKQDVDSWRAATVMSAQQIPYLLQAVIYAGASYSYFFGATDSSTNLLRINAYHETLRLLREAMIDPTTDFPDEMLLAIAMLAIHGPPRDVQGHTVRGGRELKDYEYYGSKTWEKSHLQALLSLTKQRGGLPSIGMDSLKGIIFTIDITAALNALKKPTFPLFFPPMAHLKGLRQRQTGENSEQAGLACQGFRFLRRKKNGSRLLAVLENTLALVEAYSALLQGHASGMDFRQLVATWRVLQHQALSLGHGREPLWELCRIAVIVYLTECLEPLPVIGPFHENSSRKLTMVIDECDKLGYWQTSSELLLWVTILGGYTARGSFLRRWYTEQLRGSPVKTLEECWGEVLTLSDNYLPLRGRHGEGCREFWNEACAWLSGPRHQYPG